MSEITITVPDDQFEPMANAFAVLYAADALPKETPADLMARQIGNFCFDRLKLVAGRDAAKAAQETKEQEIRDVLSVDVTTKPVTGTIVNRPIVRTGITDVVAG